LIIPAVEFSVTDQVAGQAAPQAVAPVTGGTYGDWFGRRPLVEAGFPPWTIRVVVSDIHREHVRHDATVRRPACLLPGEYRLLKRIDRVMAAFHAQPPQLQ
jgi:hypothetical protein